MAQVATDLADILNKEPVLAADKPLRLAEFVDERSNENKGRRNPKGLAIRTENNQEKHCSYCKMNNHSLEECTNKPRNIVPSGINNNLRNQN